MGTIVGICQYGGQFVSKDDGTMSYTGGEAHALNINHDMTFSDLKSEIASMFDIDSSTMTIKYFLPINKQTLITVSSDKDFERMIEFNVNSLTIDIYVSNKVDNRTIRSLAADSGTSIVDTAAGDRNLRSGKTTTASKIRKRATKGRISIADSNTPKVASSGTADTVKQYKKAVEKISSGNVADDSTALLATAPPIDINRQERVELDTVDKVDNNRANINIIGCQYPPQMGFSVDIVDNIGSQHSMNPWDSVITDVGQEFDNVRAFRDELCKYAFAKGFTYRYIKNDNARVTAKCTSDNCPWRLHASRSARRQKFIIKKINNVHTCGARTGEDGHRRAKKQWLASIIRGKILNNPESRPRDIARDLYEEYGISLSYTQAWHAKETAQKEIHMLQEETCNQLPWVCEQIMKFNPGSVTVLAASVDAKIRRFFISFSVSLHGFEHGCRPLIFLDRLQLKVNNHWKLLVAASIDGDDEIFPVAFATVEDETPDSWQWFLLQLKYAITASHKITIVSSRRKDLDESVPQIFADSYHGYSLSHLVEDFKAELKKGPWLEQVRDAMVEDFKGAAQAYLVEDFNAYMDRVSNVSKELAEWVISTKPDHWSNALFRGARYDHLSSNVIEPLSRWITMKDESSVVQMIEALLVKTKDVVDSRQQACSEWQDEGKLTPSMERKLQKETSRSRTLNVLCSTDTVFEVRGSTVNVVDIGSWECTCRRWQITGLPCMHAIAVCDRVGRSVYDYCSRYFRRENYLLAYSAPIQTIPDIDKMKFLVPASSYPPPTNRPPGRPKRKRINPNKTTIRPLHCSRCKVAGHNKATCEAQL